MGIDWSITGSSCQIFVVPVRNMSFIVFHDKPFGKPEVNHINLVLVGSSADQEIVGFDISMQYPSLMDKLDQLEHFESDHDAGFEGEFAVASVEHIFEGLAQVVHDHHIIISLSSDVVDLGDVDFFPDFLGLDELSDELGLVEELRSFG